MNLTISDMGLISLVEMMTLYSLEWQQAAVEIRTRNCNYIT